MSQHSRLLSEAKPIVVLLSPSNQKSTFYPRIGNDCILQYLDEVNEPKQAKHEHSRKAGVFILSAKWRKQLFNKQCSIKRESLNWPGDHTFSKNPGIGVTWERGKGGKCPPPNIFFYLRIAFLGIDLKRGKQKIGARAGKRGLQSSFFF